YVFRLIVQDDLSQLRSEMLLSGTDALGASLGRTIAGTASFFYCYNILLFFYSLTFRHDNKWLLILLIVSSTSRIFHALTYIGRDGLLFWILSFFFTYFLFAPYLNKEAKKLVRKLFYVCGTFVLLLIAAITLSRFSESDNGAIWSLVSYLGQPIDNFAKMFHSNYNLWEGTRGLFPLLFGDQVQSAADLLSSVDDFEAKFGFKNNVFYSFVGSFYMCWGPIITIIVALLYNYYMTKRLNNAYSSMSVMIILMIASHIVLNNYFYWAYYIRVANLFIFSTPIFVIFCSKSNCRIVDADQYRTANR
ncbi:MAG: oligosaccharide repeat unit polymerase, partial [Prevotellaceae bacterium]|nr:oligosaccharide repeat unit polymerase [Prevotellaceae bacterium]